MDKSLVDLVHDHGYACYHASRDGQIIIIYIAATALTACSDTIYECHNDAEVRDTLEYLTIEQRFATEAHT